MASRKSWYELTSRVGDGPSTKFKIVIASQGGHLVRDGDYLSNRWIVNIEDKGSVGQTMVSMSLVSQANVRDGV